MYYIVLLMIIYDFNLYWTWNQPPDKRTLLGQMQNFFLGSQDNRVGLILIFAYDTLSSLVLPSLPCLLPNSLSLLGNRTTSTPCYEWKRTLELSCPPLLPLPGNWPYLLVGLSLKFE